MTERADQLVLEFLGRVADAAYGALRSDERLDFLTRLRARIEEMRARTKAERPAQVRGILERFGDPAVLVERERERLAATHRAQQRELGSNDTIVTGLGTDASVPPDQVPPDQVPPDQVPPDQLPPHQTQPIPVPVRPAGQDPVDDGAGADDGATGSAADEPAEPAETGADAAAPGGRWTATGRPLPGDAAARRRADFLDIAQANKQASVAIVLLGFGALALPVPLWIIGVALTVFTRAWGAGEKLLAAALPIAAVAVYALATDRAADVLGVAVYSSTTPSSARLVFGLGGLAGAAYLAWRLRVRANG